MPAKHCLRILVLAGALSGCGERYVTPPPPPPVVTEVAVVQEVRDPLIQSLTANPSHVAAPGQAITFQVVADDPQGKPLQYSWSATGGLLSATVGRVVSWVPPEKPGIYTVTVAIANDSGGMTVGSLNLVAKADGSAELTSEK